MELCGTVQSHGHDVMYTLWAGSSSGIEEYQSWQTLGPVAPKQKWKRKREKKKEKGKKMEILSY